MSLSDLGSVGFVSALAVVASVLYLAAQVRQASANQRGMMHQMRAALSADVMLRIAEADLSASFRAGLTGASAITKASFGSSSTRQTPSCAQQRMPSRSMKTAL